MTTAITFSHQNDVGSRASTTYYWENLVHLVVLVYPVGMTQKPRKEDFRELKSKQIPGEASSQTPPPPGKACAFGAHLGNRSVFILDLRLLSQE